MKKRLLCSWRPGSAALAAAFVLAPGCTHAQRAASAPTSPAGASFPTTTATHSEASGRLDGCVGRRDGKKMEIEVAGSRLDGVVIGRGPVGVVLAHERGRNLCDWLPYAHHLARLGFTALAFDFKTYAAGLVESVEGAADELRRRGAEGILLIGASMGGTAVLDAARRVPGILGVVSVSGPASYGDANAARAVRALRAPVLFIVAHDDSEFLGDAHSLYEHASSTDKTLEVLPGFAHGTGFFAAPLSGRAVRLADRFVAEHGRQ
jgi:pimeloyl-ACP methyl ester carboxylesterase